MLTCKPLSLSKTRVDRVNFDKLERKGRIMILKEAFKLAWVVVVTMVIINFDSTDHKTTRLVISSLAMVLGAFALTTGIRLIIDERELSGRGFMSAGIGSIIMAISLIIWEGDSPKWFFVSFLGGLGIWLLLHTRASKT